MLDRSFYYVSYCTLSFWRTCFRVPRQSLQNEEIIKEVWSRRSSLSLLTLDGSCLRPCDTQPIVFFQIWAFLTKYRAAVSSFSTFVFVLLQLLEFTVVLECNVWINVTQEHFVLFPDNGCTLNQSNPFILSVNLLCKLLKLCLNIWNGF